MGVRTAPAALRSTDLAAATAAAFMYRARCRHCCRLPSRSCCAFLRSALRLRASAAFASASASRSSRSHRSCMPPPLPLQPCNRFSLPPDLGCWARCVTRDVTQNTVNGIPSLLFRIT